MTSERQNYFNIKLISQNIYNVKKHIRKKKLSRYTFTQTLLKILHRQR